MAVKVEPHSLFPEIYWATVEDGSRRLATKNLASGRSVYGERLIRHMDVEYRLWDPFRSKLAASILKGLGTVPIRPNHKVLYLGAASGTTASHVSDIVGGHGHVYCVEFAPRAIRELINNVCAFRPNMSPILADARLPEQYSFLVEEVDDIYADLAQPNQAEIVADNAELFLKGGGWVMFAIKARSVDVTKKPSDVYEMEIKVLCRRGFNIVDVAHLEPYELDHAMVVATYER